MYVTALTDFQSTFYSDKLQNHKWENAMTIDQHSWGYRRDANFGSYLSIENLVGNLVSTVRYQFALRNYAIDTEELSYFHRRLC